MKLHKFKSESNEILKLCPLPFKMYFADLGCLEEVDGNLRFTGNAEESARVFFDFLNQHYLKSQEK